MDVHLLQGIDILVHLFQQDSIDKPIFNAEDFSISFLIIRYKAHLTFNFLEPIIECCIVEYVLRTMLYDIVEISLGFVGAIHQIEIDEMREVAILQNMSAFNDVHY